MRSFVKIQDIGFLGSWEFLIPLNLKHFEFSGFEGELVPETKILESRSISRFLRICICPSFSKIQDLFFNLPLALIRSVNPWATFAAFTATFVRPGWKFTRNVFCPKNFENSNVFTNGVQNNFSFVNFSYAMFLAEHFYY